MNKFIDIFHYNNNFYFYLNSLVKYKIINNMKQIFYWANDVEKNSGEGILARNFLNLLKKKI